MCELQIYLVAISKAQTSKPCATQIVASKILIILVTTPVLNYKQQNNTKQYTTKTNMKKQIFALKNVSELIIKQSQQINCLQGAKKQVMTKVYLQILSTVRPTNPGDWPARQLLVNIDQIKGYKKNPILALFQVALQTDKVCRNNRTRIFDKNGKHVAGGFWAVILTHPARARRWARCDLVQSVQLRMRFVPKQAVQHKPSM